MLRTTSASILFVVVLMFSTLARGQTFQNARYSSPNGPTDSFVADLNHDGHDDIVTTQFSANMVTVFLNHGNGVFTSGGSASYVTAPQPNVITVADFNGDGNPDIATAGCSPSGNPSFVSVLFGRGDGTFKNYIDYTIPQCAFSIGTIKVGKDTLPSLLMADGTHIQILRNNGAGVFKLQTITYPGSDRMFYASAGDYNRDGIRDIAMVEQNTPLKQNRLLIFNGKADGTFAAPRVVFASSTTVSGSIFMSVVNTVDVNGDGIADLLVDMNQDEVTTAHGGVQAFINTGAGNFKRVVMNLGTEQFNSGRMTEGDFRGTGLHDIVTGMSVSTDSAAPQQDSIVIFPATSKTSWGPPKFFPLSDLNPSGTARGHFNTDAKLDLAFITNSPDSMHVFLNTTAQCSAPAAAGVAICSPISGSTVTSPVKIAAAANGGSNKITAMKAYIDGTQVASSTTSSLNASVTKAAGSHKLTVNAWDNTGKLYQASATFTVH
jgi:FG-GAP-like repeat/Bacterial Ig domain